MKIADDLGSFPPDPEPERPDLSPEARRHAQGGVLPGEKGHSLFVVILRRAALGTWNDGFIHAGNLAYMCMLAIFPFFILGAAVLAAIGEPDEQMAAVNGIVAALPPNVGSVIGPPARDVIGARSGWMLWVGALVALWTVGSLVETVRDILRRAYGTVPTMGFWRHRLISSGIIMGSMLLLLLALLAQVMIGALEEAIDAFAPHLTGIFGGIVISRILPAVVVFITIYLLLLSLTPSQYRSRRYPKWPGALLVTVWWVVVSAAFPPLLRQMFSYSLTYGGLAGMMIALFFFWLVGLGVVAGAELNAALARTPEEEDSGSPDHSA